MKTIGLLIPSRERLNLKLTLISSIITTAKDINNVNIYFGIDDDDPTKETVLKIASAIPFVKVIPIHNDGQFIGLSRIWNILAANCPDEIFGYIGDDMIFRTPNWDEKVLEQFANCPKDGIQMVHCNDGYHGKNLCVNAFVGRKYYETVGYFCREEFLINWSDSWMYQMFDAFNRIVYIPDVLIEHNHWVFKKRAKDATAERMLSNDHDKTSDHAWTMLGPQRDAEAMKLSKYLDLIPDWSKIENKQRK